MEFRNTLNKDFHYKFKRVFQNVISKEFQNLQGMDKFRKKHINEGIAEGVPGGITESVGIAEAALEGIPEGFAGGILGKTPAECTRETGGGLFS